MSEHRKVICPICGTAHGMEVTERVEGKPYLAKKRRNYWERTLHFDPDKPFGVIMETTGRGTFHKIGDFSPEEDTDGFFPLVKNRMLQALKEWVDKGWISPTEIGSVLER